MNAPLRGDTWVLEPRGRGLPQRLKEAWRARALVRYFAHRSAEQIVSRTLLGFLWLILRPAIPIAIMTVVFGFFVNLRQGLSAPYLVFLLYGMTAWSAFDGPAHWGTRGLYQNRSLLAKIYFPRIIVPAAATFPGVIEFTVHLGFLVVALGFYWALDGALYLAWSWGLLLGLAALVLSFTLAVGLCLFTALWDYQARDTRYTLQIIMRFLLYLTPVIYPASMVPAQFRTLYFANPLAGIIETFRNAMMGDLAAVPYGALAYSAVFALVLLVLGALYFNAAESAAIDRA